MSELDIPGSPRPAPTRSRWWKRLVIAGLLLLTLGLGAYAYLLLAGSRELEAVITELDAADPGWRFEELEAKGKSIPDEQNSALQVLAAKKLTPQSRPGPEFYNTLEDLGLHD